MSSLEQIVQQLAADGHPSLPDGHPIADDKVHRYGTGKSIGIRSTRLSAQVGSSVTPARLAAGPAMTTALSLSSGTARH